MSDLVGNPEDRFSHNEAHIQCHKTFMLRPACTALQHYESQEISIFRLSRQLTVLVSIEHMSLVVRKLVFGFPTRSDTNRAVRPQKIARGLKFRI